MGTIDLNAARAARAEKLGKRTVVIGKKRFELLPEFPMHVADLWAQGKTVEGLDVLFRGQFAKFMAADGVTAEDLIELVASLRREYGLEKPGESKASRASSRTTGRRSRPTSAGSTRSGSPKRAGARKRSGSARSAR